jgi:6-phosphogluconolactonase
MHTADDRFHAFLNADDMTRALADEIVTRVDAGVTSRGAASLVVSGGTTPAPLFDLLSTRAAPWDKAWITLSDERWIAPDQDGSNEKLVRTRLLRDAAAGAKLVPLKTTDPSPRAAEAKVDAAIAAMPRPFDIVLLGMGDDGHTASLFPHATGLAVALDTTRRELVRAIHTDEAAAVATGERLTLTLRAILESRLVVVLIRGTAKREAYQSAAAGSNVLDAPVRAVLQQTRVPVQVCWAP